MKRLLPLGSRVRYSLGVERRDRYGRALAYVYTGDGRLLNLLLVRRGYAQPLTIPPNDRARRHASSPPHAGHGRAAWACGRPGRAYSRATLLRHVTSPDGVRLASQVEGEGTPLVMVHGAGSGRWSFDLVRPHLHDRFEVWALDRRGRGDSCDADAYSIQREFDDVAAVVREAGAGALLFGHSYGGLVAAGAAERLGGVPRLAIYEGPMGGVLADEPWTASFEQRVEVGRARAPRCATS